MNFSNFHRWAVYISMVINHEQYILLQHDSADRERNNFEQLPKLIELIAISTACAHQLSFTNKITHQQISTIPKSFVVTLKTLNVKH